MVLCHWGPALPASTLLVQRKGFRLIWESLSMGHQHWLSHLASMAFGSKIGARLVFTED